MPFKEINMIEEARELQEMFKDDTSLVKKYKDFEARYIELEELKKQEEELINKLIEIRKQKNITQKELQEKTGMSQQAISRLEVNKDITPTLKSLIKYAEALNCKLIPVEK